MMRILNLLTKNLRDASVFNPEVQIAPACILWPDKDRQWEAVIPRLQAELPELLVLGNYEPEKRIGPAIWLRCIIANKVEDVSLPNDRSPIFYLPGVSRQDLRAVESCPDHLKPLAELQYRGVIWSQINAKDWTILAFLKSDQGGLALDVAQDNETKNAMQLALYRLLDEEVALLKCKRLDKDYFNTLLTGGDPVRDLLQWLDQGDAFQNGRGQNEWKAFTEVCKSQMAFNPQKEGVLAGAAKLAAHVGPWQAIWERFCEAPKRYPNIPGQIRRCKAPNDSILWHMGEGNYEGWPQWNEDHEKSLRQELATLNSIPVHEARKKIVELEKRHAGRRQLVWAELGEAPLAQALEFLSIVAEITKNGLAAGSMQDLMAGYQNQGWQADDAVIQALAVVEKAPDVDAVTTAVRALYLPWAEESARHLQKIWDHALLGRHEKKDAAGDCILFVDGLRFDCAKRLSVMLEKDGCTVAEKPRWATLPSVTGTGKPAVAPIVANNAVAEEPAPYNFEPLSAYQLKKAIEDNGWTIPEKSLMYSLTPFVDGQKLWVEFGDIDHEGHSRGYKLARHIPPLLEEIRNTIKALFAAGLRTVRVVTDHGWLLLPGGLPKIELPSWLSENKWGRCASLKPGAATEERLYPWYWNQNQHFALADGISCFRKGEEYAHGGLSLQECLTLELVVTAGASCGSACVAEFTDVAWKGLRCTAEVDGRYAGLLCDIRLEAGDPCSSVAKDKKAKMVEDDGKTSLLVIDMDGDLQGREAYLVLLDANGALLVQAHTIIGGGK
jgi:hypothetical protein